MKNPDLVIIGGGPAGLSAAVAAYEAGLRDILILERDRELGGILNSASTTVSASTPSTRNSPARNTPGGSLKRSTPWASPGSWTPWSCPWGCLLYTSDAADEL